MKHPNKIEDTFQSRVYKVGTGPYNLCGPLD
jgi:hypothetical protein